MRIFIFLLRFIYLIFICGINIIKVSFTISL
nr:MAG TPA: hypothetical protein [Caudoviricetes sp.]